MLQPMELSIEKIEPLEILISYCRVDNAYRSIRPATENYLLFLRCEKQVSSLISLLKSRSTIEGYTAEVISPSSLSLRLVVNRAK